MSLKRYLKSSYIIALMALCTTTITVQAQNIISTDAKPALLAPGVISTPAGEFAPTFTPDGKTVYFTGGPNFIYFSILINGSWTKPELANFSGKWKDMDPFLSPDGKRLFFSSYRPVDGSQQQQKFAHIWYTDHLSGNKWSEAHHLDAPVNLAGVNNYAPAVSQGGTLFFFSPNRDAANRSSYYSKWLGDHYAAPVLIPIKGDGGIHDPFISADEHFLIFASGGDLYISFQTDGHWSDRQKLGPLVNDGNKNSSPCVSPDNKTLYYSSSGKDGILMIPVKMP